MSNILEMFIVFFGVLISIVFTLGIPILVVVSLFKFILN